MYLSLFRANCKLSVTKTCGLPSHLTSSNADPQDLGPDLCQIVANPITVINYISIVLYFRFQGQNDDISALETLFSNIYRLNDPSTLIQQE